MGEIAEEDVTITGNLFPTLTQDPGENQDLFYLTIRHSIVAKSSGTPPQNNQPAARRQPPPGQTGGRER